MLELLPQKDEGLDQRQPKPILDNHANSSRMGWGIKIVVAILGLLSLLFFGARWNIAKLGERLQALLPTPPAQLTLIDEVEHFPAPWCKAIPLSLPHDAVASVQVRVLRGNSVDVFLIAPGQLEAIVKGDWSHIESLGGVTAIKTDSYQHIGQLAKGGYYLVVMDRMISVPSSEPSEVAVMVQLKQ